MFCIPDIDQSVCQQLIIKLITNCNWRGNTLAVLVESYVKFPVLVSLGTPVYLSFSC